METSGLESMPAPAPAEEPIQETDIRLWEGLCSRALEDEDQPKLEFYLDAAESVGVTREVLLPRLQEEFPDDPILASLTSALPPTMEDPSLPPDLSPPPDSALSDSGLPASETRPMSTSLPPASVPPSPPLVSINILGR